MDVQSRIAKRIGLVLKGLLMQSYKEWKIGSTRSIITHVKPYQALATNLPVLEIRNAVIHWLRSVITNLQEFASDPLQEN